MTPTSTAHTRAERLTLGVLMSGVAALALSDFVSPIYWAMPCVAALFRFIYRSRFSLTEMQASMIGWVGFIWVGLELVLGRAWVVAFTDFLLILSLAVIVEEATPRNFLHRILTGFFLILAGAVLSDSVLYAIPLAATLWFIWRSAVCLYGIQPQGQHLPAPTRAEDVRTFAIMLCLALLLFVLLPRVDSHSQLKAMQPRMQTTGFSERVQLGDFARQLDRTVVMRIESTDGDIPAFRNAIMNRYWRGVVLSRYKNNSWQQRHSPAVHLWHAGQSIQLHQDTASALPISVFREASDHAYIMQPDGLQGIQAQADNVLQDDLQQLRFQSPPQRRLRLNMRITPHLTRYPDTQAPQAEEISTQVPQVIQQWVNNTTSPKETTEQALQTLNNTLHGWTYDLHAPIDAEHPLASFLRYKRGHCEFYATTLALGARVLGIPSRIVNGYVGGEWNDTGQFLIIRQQHAHSWVEVWLQGRWQRLDPTPASRWQLQNAIRFPAWDQLWESVKLNWYRYILEFQSQDQQALLKAVASWFKQALPGLVLAIIVYIAWHQYKQRRSTPQTHSKQLRIIHRWLKKHGVHRQSYQPLCSLPTPEGVDKQAWQQWCKQWEASVYGDMPAISPHQLRKQLRALTRSITPASYPLRPKADK